MFYFSLKNNGVIIIDSIIMHIVIIKKYIFHDRFIIKPNGYPVIAAPM